jgi:DNA-directed RNA polymerase specialized sigma24 family protein
MRVSEDTSEQISAYRAKLIGFMRRKGNRLEDAEDIAQEAILRALNNEEEIRYVPAFLGQTALNIARAQDSVAARHSTFETALAYDHFFENIQSNTLANATVLLNEIVEYVATMKTSLSPRF